MDPRMKTEPRQSENPDPESELASKPVVAEPAAKTQGDDQPGTEDEGGGPKDKETITREWHERKLRKEGQRRARIEAENRRMRDELKAYKDREARASAEDLLKDLGIPQDQAVIAGVLGKVTERILTRVEERLAQQGEKVGALAEEFTQERRKAAFRGLSEDQHELVDAISEETGIKAPGELLALARMRDPELFAGYEPDKGSWETSPARGSPSRRRGEPTIEDQIASLQKEINDPANKRRIHTELGPKLMGLQRLRQQGMR